MFAPRIDPRLDLYASASNEQRVREILAPVPRRPTRKRTRGVSVLVLSRDRPDLIVPLCEALKRQRALAIRERASPIEIVVGDTGSTDPKVLDYYRKNRRTIRVVGGLEYHFSANNNHLAFEYSEYDTLLFLNNDVMFPKGRSGDVVVATMASTLRRMREIGILGLRLLFPDGTLQHGGVDFFGTGALRGLPFHPKNLTAVDAAGAAAAAAASWPRVHICPAVTGACLMISAALFEAVGGMDEAYLAECQDVALCLSAHRSGHASAVIDLGPVVHIENATRPRGHEHWPDRQRLLRKWGGYIEACFL